MTKELYDKHTRTHAHTRTRTHAHAHARAHTPDSPGSGSVGKSTPAAAADGAAREWS